MTTHEFMQLLKTNGKRELRFLFQNGKGLPAGYHFTEVKNVRVESVDCGGAADTWTETVIQLWLPSAVSEDRAMQASKALDILKKVNTIRPMDSQAPCRFEAEESGLTAIYDVDRAEVNSKGVMVYLTSQKTQCKAQRRDATACGGSAKEASESACCGPAEKTKAGSCC